jgi:hypothetical protein
VLVRGQDDRAVRGEDVAEVHPLGDRAGGDLEGAGGDDDLAASCGLRDRRELPGDRSLCQPASLLGRGWSRRHRGHRLAQLGADGCDGKAEALDPVAEVGGHAQADLVAVSLQCQGQRHQRLDIASRSDRRQEHAHRSLPLSSSAAACPQRPMFAHARSAAGPCRKPPCWYYVRAGTVRCSSPQPSLLNQPRQLGEQRLRGSCISATASSDTADEAAARTRCGQIPLLDGGVVGRGDDARQKPGA